MTTSFELLLPRSSSEYFSSLLRPKITGSNADNNDKNYSDETDTSIVMKWRFHKEISKDIF